MANYELKSKHGRWEKFLEADKKLGNAVSEIGFYAGAALSTTSLTFSYILPGETDLEAQNLLNSGLSLLEEIVIPPYHSEIPISLEYVTALSIIGMVSQKVLTEKINYPLKDVIKMTLGTLGMANVTYGSHKLYTQVMEETGNLAQIAYDTGAIGLGLLLMYSGFKFLKEPKKDISREFE